MKEEGSATSNVRDVTDVKDRRKKEEGREKREEGRGEREKARIKNDLVI
ncbi:hypothetical protein QUA82_16695 [Microcoleus sp. F8-D3]